MRRYPSILGNRLQPFISDVVAPPAKLWTFSIQHQPEKLQHSSSFINRQNYIDISCCGVSAKIMAEKYFIPLWLSRRDYCSLQRTCDYCGKPPQRPLHWPNVSHNYASCLVWALQRCQTDNDITVCGTVAHAIEAGADVDMAWNFMPRVSTEDDDRAWDPLRKRLGTNPISLLGMAAFWNNTGLAQILLEAGSRIDYAPCPGFPPIIVAVLSGRCRMTKFLIEKGAKLNVWTPDGDGPLAAAVYVNSAECVEALLAVLEDADEKDAIEDINEEESSRPTALIRAAGGNHEGFVRRLLGRAEVNPNRMWIRDEGPWLTPLTVACIMDSVACVQLLCQDGRTDLKRMDSYTATALLTAVRKASWDVAFYLLGLERLRQHRWREVGEFLFSLSPGYRYDARAVEFATELIRRVHMTDEIATSWKQIATGSGNRHIVKLIDLELARKLMIPPCSAERFQPLMHMYKE